MAITLTVQTEQVDQVTKAYQTETKALLNVSPRNVFNTWEYAGMGYTDRIQSTPAQHHGLAAAGAVMDRPTIMHEHSERGIALILTLFLMSALSVLAASLMFLSQTETYASMNYKMMSQARYAAESGVQKAANFLLDSTQYTVPGGVSDPLSNYDRTKSPVICLSGCPNNNQPVVLSATTAKASNYPAAAVQTAFNNAAKGTLTAADATMTYGAYATLIAMQVFDSYGGGQAVVQTWEITANGTLVGRPNGHGSSRRGDRNAEGASQFVRGVRDGQHVRRPRFHGQRHHQQLRFHQPQRIDGADHVNDRRQRRAQTATSRSAAAWT